MRALLSRVEISTLYCWFCERNQRHWTAADGVAVCERCGHSPAELPDPPRPQRPIDSPIK